MLGIFAGRQHNKIRELLSAYIDGEVSEAEAAQVDEHLEQCDECRAEFDSLSSTVNLLIALPQLDLPRSFVLTEEPAPVRAAFSFVWPTRVAAGMAAAFLLALLLGDFAGFITQSSSIGPTFESDQVQPAAPAPAAPAAPAPAAPAPPAIARALPAAPAPAAPAPSAPAAAAAPVPRSTIDAQKAPQVDTSEQAAAPTADVPSIVAAPAPAPPTAATPAPTSAPATAAAPAAAPAPAPTPEPAQAFASGGAAPSETTTADVTESPREAAASGSVEVPGTVPPVAPAVTAEQLEATAQAPVERTSPLSAIEFDRTPVGAVEQATSAPPEETAPIIESATDDDDGLDIPLWQLEVGTVAALVALLGAVVWITRRRRFSP